MHFYTRYVVYEMVHEEESQVGDEERFLSYPTLVLGTRGSGRRDEVPTMSSRLPDHGIHLACSSGANGPTLLPRT